MLDHSTHAAAVDAFDQLLPASYLGEIKPGAFLNRFSHEGNLHCSLGLALDIGETNPRVVCVTFLIDGPRALEAAKRDAKTLASWAQLVGAPVAPDWSALVQSLWFGQRRLGVDLSFEIRPVKQGRGYNLLGVKVVWP
jgi:hypothetical protein